MGNLRIAQHNIQSIKNKKPLLKTFLFNNNIDICLLNETWLKDTSPCLKIPGYEYIGKNADNEHGGVGILLRDSIKFKPIKTSFHQDIQNIAISVETEVGSLAILCVYCPPANQNRGNRLKINKLRKIIKDLPSPCLVSGDFNAHHIAFGCQTTKARGKELYDLFDETNLCIMNDGTSTTVQSPHNNVSAIDVTCVSPLIAPLCVWRVGDDPLGSYHYPTFIDITTSSVQYCINNDVQKYMYHKADWIKYYLESESIFKNYNLDANAPLSSYELFCELINEIKSKCIPTRRVSKKINRIPAPWWNKECDDAVKKSQEALQIFRIHFNLESFIEYKKNDAMKKRIISECRKNSWKNLCSTLNRYTPI